MKVNVPRLPVKNEVCNTISQQIQTANKLVFNWFHCIALFTPFLQLSGQ